MPELPEVQTVVQSLQDLKNKKILDFKYYWKKVIYNFPINRTQDILRGNTINNISRKGKYIILKLDNQYLVGHLRMTGQLYISKALPVKKNHLRCVFLLDNNKFLIFEDMRKFGGFFIYNNLDILNAKIGIDPFQKIFTVKWLKINLFKKKRMMKHLLLDQKFICGLGNIYIDEILWKSQIHPKALSNKVQSIKNLHYNLLSILNESIKFHGTTIMNFKFDNMKTGNYKNNLKVYGRYNLPCYTCNSMIIKEKIAGRSTYYCKYCQN